MDLSDAGIAVDDIVEQVKKAIRVAGISSSNEARDLYVTSVQLVLNTVAMFNSGGGVDFRVPVLGMKLKFGGLVTRQDTHRIEIAMAPPEVRRHEIRDSPVESVLLDAIETIRSVLASAAGGDDPFLLKDSSVELSFVITREGSIALGFNGELKDEIHHSLRLVLGLPSAENVG